MYPRRGIDPRKQQLEESERGIETVLRDVGPELEAVVEVRVQYTPVHDCDEEGEGCYARPEEVV